MNEQDSEKLLLALVGAYVWVASSDNGVDLDEYNKFQKVMVESPFATQYDMNNVRYTFKDMVALFIDDYEKGIKETRKHLKEIANNPVKAEEVIRFIRAAVISDNQIKEVEETVIRQVAKELNIINQEI